GDEISVGKKLGDGNVFSPSGEPLFRKCRCLHEYQGNRNANDEIRCRFHEFLPHLTCAPELPHIIGAEPLNFGRGLRGSPDMRCQLPRTPFGANARSPSLPRIRLPPVTLRTCRPQINQAERAFPPPLRRFWTTVAPRQQRNVDPLAQCLAVGRGPRCKPTVE